MSLYIHNLYVTVISSLVGVQYIKPIITPKSNLHRIDVKTSEDYNLGVIIGLT